MKCLGLDNTKLVSDRLPQVITRTILSPKAPKAPKPEAADVQAQQDGEKDIRQTSVWAFWELPFRGTMKN